MRRLLFCLVLAAGLLVAVPSVTGAATKKAAANPLYVGMVYTQMLSDSPTVAAEAFAAMKSDHVTVVRIEDDPTILTQAQVDTEVSDVTAAGLVPLMIMQNETDESNPNAFGTWATAQVDRYAPKGVNYYEVWNEPNNTAFWASPSASAYTALLKVAYTTIHAADKSAFVVSGGLAPEANSGGDINEVTFLTSMYADGAHGYFDAIGDHPYSYPALPNTYEAWSGFSELSATSPSIRSVMVANGDSAKQVWITEVGWPSNTTSNTGVAGLTAEADEMSQVASFVEANSWVANFIWYEWQDDSASAPFGIYTSTWAAKPALTTLQGL